jgi:uncharacterized protein YggU (UPF0235/DUF167 family)
MLMLARALDVPRRQIMVVAGEHGRKKTLRIEGAGLERVLALAEVT